MGTEIYDDGAIHRAMLADRVRNQAFWQAIRASVKPGDIVVDVGAGTGILSAWAARAGARRVYAIERASVAHQARLLLHTAGLDDRVHLIQADVRNVRIPEQADVIVSEWLGTFGVDENLLPILLAARDRWLKPDGRLLPAVVTAWLAPVEVDLAAAVVRGHCALSTSQVGWFHTGLPLGSLLAAGKPMWTTDVRTIPAEAARLPFRGSLRLVVERPGNFTGLTAWFEADFGNGISLNNAPGAPETHWGQLVFPLHEPIDVRPGDALTVEFLCIPSGPGYCHYAWSIWTALSGWQHCDTREVFSS